MNLHVINTGNLKLDGGAMFGVVPKSIWQRLNPADENNMCSWSMRCLLVEDEDRLTLIDNGIGDKQSAKFFSYYYLHGNDNLLQSIKTAGFHANEITDMFMTHLHFDHVGGGVKYKEGTEKLEMTFKNARYWTNKSHWQWAIQPNAREKASFLKENILPIKDQGHLHFIDDANVRDFGVFDICYVDGHTEKQMLPKIQYKGKTILFVADLIPSSHHIPIPYVMGYDVRPLETLKEKSEILQEACENNYILFFEHDPLIECCTLKMTDRGVRIDETFRLSEI